MNNNLENRKAINKKTQELLNNTLKMFDEWEKKESQE